MKELLRQQGVDDSVIALWIRRDDGFINNTKVCRNEFVKKNSVCKRKGQEKSVTAIVSPAVCIHWPLSGCPQLFANDCQDEIRQDDSGGPIANESSPTLSPELVDGQAESPDSESMRPQLAKSLSVTPLAPCKLISHLAANPSADITHISTLAKGTNGLDEREGVEYVRGLIRSSCLMAQP